MTSSDSDSESTTSSENVGSLIPFNTPKTDIAAKYEKLKGKSLFLRFPNQLTTDVDELNTYVKSLCDLVVKVRRPRQKSTRFCLVDFDSEQDRNNAITMLKQVKVEKKKLVVEIPRTENQEFVNKLVEKRKVRSEVIQAKLKMQHAARSSEQHKSKVYTSTLIVRNIPASATVTDIKKHFPDAIDMQLTFAKGNRDTSQAIVTFPTPMDATKIKKQTIEINDNILNITYASQSPPKASLKRKVTTEKSNQRKDDNKGGSENNDDENDSDDEVQQDEQISKKRKLVKEEPEKPAEYIPLQSDFEKVPKKKIRIGLKKKKPKNKTKQTLTKQKK